MSLRPKDVGYCCSCPAFYTIKRMVEKGFLYIGYRLGSWPHHVFIGHGHWWNSMLMEYTELKNVSVDSVELCLLSRGYFPSDDKVGIFVRMTDPLLWIDCPNRFVRRQIEGLIK